MVYTLEEKIKEKFEKIFDKLGYDKKYAVIKNSDRPDLSDFQCNAALALAKMEKKNPRQIAEDIVADLSMDKDFEKVSVDGPGFINLSLNNTFLAQYIDDVCKDDRYGCPCVSKKKTIVLDYGGPNVAKEMHVGHLRSGVIGESIRRIENFVGNKTIADVHLGDWGTPMGMILAQVIEQDGTCENITKYNIAEITEFYKKANICCKENEEAKERARVITAELQNGKQEYVEAWQHIRKISVEAIKANYQKLGVYFDLWLGESDAHKECFEITKIAKQKGLLEFDEGAYIIRLDEDKKPKPPVIIEKTDGGFTYQATDLATIKMRVENLNADEIIYFTDKRQQLHFEQVFEAAQKLEIVPKTVLKHIGFGTVNGSDGKPFKTRDGGVMTLDIMIKMAKEKVAESMPKAGKDSGFSEDELNKLIDQITIGAIKFQDLKNNISSGYIFDLKDFANFEGKTGPYIQYAVARINSIIRKNPDVSMQKIIVTNNEERNLMLSLAQFGNIVFKAEKEKEPNIISDYAYNLAQNFSVFYNTSSIKGAENMKIAGSRLKLSVLTRDVLTKALFLLGIEAPEVMPKA